MSPRSPRRPRPAPLPDLMQAPDTSGVERLHSLLNWRLLAGSHEFPGPSGGTCIIEAAIVVAGLPYRQVGSSADAPADFSPVLAEYLLQLNDQLRDGVRQRLIPFVTRLPGSARSKEIENARELLIHSETVRHILPPMLDQLGWADHAELCRLCPAGLPASQAFCKVLGKLVTATVIKPPRVYRHQVAWAVTVAAWAGLNLASHGERMAIGDRVIAIADATMNVGSRVAPVDPLTALVRLEAQRPQPPRRAKVR